MAQRMEIILVEDVDGDTGDDTVAFQLDGAEYEIDLSRANATALRSTIETWSAHARKLAGRDADERPQLPGRGPSPIDHDRIQAGPPERIGAASTGSHLEDPRRP